MIDLAMPRDGRRALAVKPPEAVVATLAQLTDAVLSKVALEVAALHAAITRSNDS